MLQEHSGDHCRHVLHGTQGKHVHAKGSLRDCVCICKRAERTSGPDGPTAVYLKKIYKCRSHASREHWGSSRSTHDVVCTSPIRRALQVRNVVRSVIYMKTPLHHDALSWGTRVTTRRCYTRTYVQNGGKQTTHIRHAAVHIDGEGNPKTHSARRSSGHGPCCA